MNGWCKDDDRALAGFTPLHLASDKTTVDLLIEAGAIIKAREVGEAARLLFVLTSYTKSAPS